ncbi:UDP-2,3-diacylglucosamine diphosphatase [Salinarimonas rosea]|uniref:UDP-2,3-diacylglucosamine diphosphatase n=1 Tax=Salinarimonas rosea TaxID=552063 RepID=UPI0004143E76|nr:UDP-2,3-diacylglucosamine diphosphatase [Salinarimonas rosea]
MTDDDQAIRVRTLFLSDFHLGTRDCQADLLLGFLRRYDADVIYLVGDIIDGWKLRGGWFWPQSHNDVVQKLLRKVRKGTRLIYVPGNHDEFLRDYIGAHFGGIEVCERALHETAAGERLLVIHGDQFDVVMKHARWLAHLGDWAYSLALLSNTYVNGIRRRLGLTYWSLSAWAKLKVKNAVNFISKFEEFLVEEARNQGATGVVCGHIHHAAQREIDGVRYLNCGDWVESCTAIVEHYDGRLELVRWVEAMAALAAQEGEPAQPLPEPARPARLARRTDGGAAAPVAAPGSRAVA